MSFIEQNLNKGEKLDKIDKPSLKPSLFALVISMGIVAYINLQNALNLPKIEIDEYESVIYMVGIFFTLRFYVDRLVNEYGITNQRVVAKSGLVSRNIEEMSLNSIESINVKQSILGRILNYGSISITGRGNALIVFKDVDSPVEIRKKIR
jgi:uncharacterized membrane protein YdbT with pleckstrin-like domain